MKVAVLPFMPAQGTPAYLGRQIASFVGEQLRNATDAEINTVTYLTQIEDADGPRVGFVNFADAFLEKDQIQQVFEQSEVDVIVDGQSRQEGDRLGFTLRFFKNKDASPAREEVMDFDKSELFAKILEIMKMLASEANLSVPLQIASDKFDFGTDNPDAFLKFLEGYDGLNYIQQAQGRVVTEFNPEVALNALIEGLQLDPDFEGSYMVLVELCRVGTQYRIGNFEMYDNALVKATQIVPDNYRAWFALGEIHQAVNDHAKAADHYERAVSVREKEHKEITEGGAADEEYSQDIGALYARVGIAQMNGNMPVNAERNFRKALEFEGEDKPSLDFLAGVLSATGRAHEVPPLLKEQVDKFPQNSQARVKYAVSLFQAGRQEEGTAAFEAALTDLEDTAIVKRYYAPILAQQNELDRAMDFFEDCIDVAPNDVALLLEYAQTLQAAERDFEIPKVLRDVLASNPDPDTRAQTLAWLIELEQPKRAETVENARQKMEQGDFDAAVRELKPLRNWLADYWKLWAYLSSAHNNLQQFDEAEDAAKRLIDLFPGCEPAFGELSTALSGQGRTEEAYNLLRYAAASNPSSLGIHLNLALAAKRVGREDEARSLARQIREAVGPNQEIEPVLAEIER